MKKNIKNISISLVAIMLVFVGGLGMANAQSQGAVGTKPVSTPAVVAGNVVSAVDVVNNPTKYLNKDIAFNAEFISFSGLGLDYKPAFRDGTKYISILIKRDDVKDHVIPLSEMKLFISRDLAEKNVDIEMGDKVRITAHVFSVALGDPWVDVKTMTITEKKNKEKKQ